MSSMRAVVQIDADASGVVTGVNKANKALEGLGGRGALGGGALGGMFGGWMAVLKELADHVTKRADELHALAVANSPEAMNAQMMTEEAQSKANRMVGQAIGPYAAAIEQSKADRIAEAAARTAANSEAIGEGMLRVDEIQNTFKTAGSAVVDSALGTLGDFDTPGPITAAMEATGTTDALADMLVPLLVSIDRQLAKLGGGS